MENAAAIMEEAVNEVYECKSQACRALQKLRDNPAFSLSDPKTGEQCNFNFNLKCIFKKKKSKPILV